MSLRGGAWGSRARAAWLVLRSRGPWFVVRRAWRRYGYGRDRLVVLAGPLTAHAGSSLPAGMTVGVATTTELVGLASLAPNARQIQALLDRREGWLHVARDGPRLIGYRFVTRGFRELGVLSNVIRLEPGQVYVDHIFVAPEYRRQHVARELLAVQNADLLRLGFREYVAAISPDNVASLRLSLQGGARLLVFVESVRRFFHHRCHVSPTMPRRVQRLVEEVRGESRPSESET